MTMRGATAGLYLSCAARSGNDKTGADSWLAGAIFKPPIVLGMGLLSLSRTLPIRNLVALLTGKFIRLSLRLGKNDVNGMLQPMWPQIDGCGRAKVPAGWIDPGLMPPPAGFRQRATPRPSNAALLRSPFALPSARH